MEEKNEKFIQIPVVFWIMVAVGVLIMLRFIGVAGFSLWFLVGLVAWVSFIMLVKRSIFAGTFVVKNALIVFSILIILTFIFMQFDGSNAQNGADQSQIEDGSSVVQHEAYTGEVFANVLTTNSSWMTGDSKERVVDYTITATANLYPTENITKITVKNITLAHMPKGTVTLLLPTGEYSEALRAEGDNEITIPVVSQDAPPKANQAKEKFGSISLQVKVEDAYRFDTNAAFKMSTNGLHGSRSFQYAGIAPSELDNVMTFDVELVLASGETVIKHFTGTVSGQEFYDEGRVKNTPLEVE